MGKIGDEIYETPLINAAKRGMLKYVKIFIEEEHENVNKIEQMSRASKIDSSSKQGKTTAFHEACRHGHLNVVEYLREKGAYMEGHSYSDFEDMDTPITLAAQHGHADVVEFLLDKGAEVKIDRYNRRSTPLGPAIKGKHIDVVCKLLSKRYKHNYDDQSAMYIAAETGYCEMVQLLLRHGFSVDERCKKSGLSPLTQAIRLNDSKMVTCLLENRANYLQQDFKTRYVPLISAIGLSVACVKSIQTLLDFIKESKGLAAMVEYLNNNDNLDGKTALHVAFRAYSESPIVQAHDLIKLFLAYGADSSIKDYFGREACDPEYIRDEELRGTLMAMIEDAAKQKQ